MRLSVRFILPLAIALSVIAIATVPLVDTLTFRWFARDLEIRGRLLANAMTDSVENYKDSPSKLHAAFERLTADERVYALGFCSPGGVFTFKTSLFPSTIICLPSTQISGDDTSIFLYPKQGPLHVSYQTIVFGKEALGTLVVVHDMKYVTLRSSATKKYLFLFFVILGSIVAAITVITAQLSWKGWVTGLRSILKGEGLFKSISKNADPELRPILKDLRSLIRDLEMSHGARDESKINWSPKALKEILNRELSGDEVIIVSNREPYIHVKRQQKIEVQFPASGLVTALEPIMRACSGTWVAHGAGSADKETVDHLDHVAVPPQDPSFQIRRVWLTKQEEDGYYYGFANEGLWPLCHIAHVRPTFRTQDWDFYQKVNQKFADAVIQEAHTEDPVILVQDYHLALVPKLIRKKLPNATVITFWHIPWPNAEAFGICPWREEILDGLLGSSILGFHTRYHCNNFIDAVDRYIESRIDRETLTISYGGNITAVNHYPISVEYPSRWAQNQQSVEDSRNEIARANGIAEGVKIGLGVDRLDYTKGILERFAAIERLLELYPEWKEKFSFIQIAAPSRSSIEDYRNFESKVRFLASQINRRFGTNSYQPIILKIEHHEPKDVYTYFRGADLCYVSSLHDGMNLVAKEFIVSRDDEKGVLILSQFAGASRELLQSLIVNPYDIDQSATALNIALTMPLAEQRSRMRTMRGLIQEFNVYRWAGKMLLDAATIRQHNRLRVRFKKSRVL